MTTDKGAFNTWLSRRLLYPEGERIIRRPLVQWECELCEIFLDICKLNKDDYINKKLLLLINQSSLVATYYGQPKIAYRICKSGIYFFFAKGYIDGVCQPWINIGRLAILKKKFSFAHKLFDSIDPNKDEFFLFKKKIDKKKLSRETKIVLKNCYFYEKIKIFLNDINCVQDLFLFCSINRHDYKEYRELFLEAETVGWLILDQPKVALTYIETSINDIDQKFFPIFMLRIVDIYIYMNSNTIEANKILSNLVDQHIFYIEGLNLQGLYFCLEICRRLKITGQVDLLISMVDKLVKRFEEIQDEVGIIETLSLIQNNYKGYQNYFSSMIRKTTYFYIKEKYFQNYSLNSFPLGQQIISHLKFA